MAWKIEFSSAAEKALDDLPKEQVRIILKFLHERLAPNLNPHSLGDSLKGNQFSGLWRYRVGDYRLICQIQDEEITVLVLRIGHRREVYR